MAAARSRLAGVDAARGLAVIGMAAVHVLPPTVSGGGTSFTDEVFSGRSSAAFAVLAGVGVALATKRSSRTKGHDRWRQRLALVLRALLIGALGLALGELDSGVAVILAYYGAYFLLLLPFLGWPPRRLIAAAAVVAVAAPVLSFLVRSRLEERSSGQPVLESLQAPGDLLVQLLLTGTYPAVPWATYLLTGLAVGRLALERPGTAARLTVAGAALALAATAVSALLLGPLGGHDRLADVVVDAPGVSVVEEVDRGRAGNVPTDSPWWLATDARHSSTTPDLVGTTGTALLVLGALLLLSRVAGVVLVPLAAVGSMPLSLYALHVTVLGLTDTDDPERYYLLQVATALVLATLWRRFLGRGPLEALLARATRAVRGGT